MLGSAVVESGVEPGGKRHAEGILCLLEQTDCLEGESHWLYDECEGERPYEKGLEAEKGRHDDAEDFNPKIAFSDQEL